MSLVQQVGYDAQSSNTPSITIAASTAGNTIIVVSAGNNNTGVPTDNKSSVWPAAIISNMSNSGLSVWALPNCAAGITTITLNTTGGGTQGWVVEENGLIASPLDKFTSQSSAGTTVTSGNTATLSSATEVCYGFFGHDNTNQFTAGSGWSSAAFTNYGGSGGGGYTAGNQGNTLTGNNTFIERQVVTSTAALAATATISSSTVDAAIITLMQAAVGPPPQPLFYNRKTVLYFIN
jgi:hypothetical protein